MKTNKKILLVEDDSNFGRILKEYLSINNYNVDLASNGIEGYEKFNRSEYDLCIQMGIYFVCPCDAVVHKWNFFVCKNVELNPHRP